METGAARKAKKTVLVVDDSPEMRMRLRDSFLSDGFTFCAEAVNGKEAIEVARECKPGLIILDFSMPVMNGIEAAPALRVIVPNAAIILFTLFADRLKYSELASAGISAVYSKNDDIEGLIVAAHGLMK